MEKVEIGEEHCGEKDVVVPTLSPRLLLRHHFYSKQEEMVEDIALDNYIESEASPTSYSRSGFKSIPLAVIFITSFACLLL